MKLRDQLKRVPVIKIKPSNVPLSKTLQASLMEVEQKDLIKLRTIEHSDYEYELVNGRRRFKALVESGATTVLAYIVGDISDTELALQALIGNSGTPNELDEARHIMALEEAGYTGQQIAKMTGYSAATISQRKKLIEKLHVKGQELLEVGDITVSVAMEATKLPLNKQEAFFSNGHLTYKDVFEEVRSHQSQQMVLFDDIETDIKPGLFLTSDMVEKLLSGETVEVNWMEQTFNLKREK